jgi:4-amino-4-deoxy-L-arabinose transferase-like glycosyltransferase
VASVLGIEANLQELRIPSHDLDRDGSTTVAPELPRLVQLLRFVRQPGRERRNVALLAVVLAIGGFLRFVQVGTKPGWQNDEPVYTSIAGNLVRHGQLIEHIQSGVAASPFLFHPPFYFLLLAGWFDLFGIGITQARDLSVVMSLIMFCLLFGLLWRLYDVGAALIIVTLVVFDGWLLFIERISYIENTLLVLVLAVMLAYQRAIERPTTRRFVIAGALLGGAVIFKHTGAYLLVALLLHWLIIRKSNRQHLLMFAVAGLVIVAYVVAMIVLYDGHGHDWYLNQSAVQLFRVLGIRSSGGTLQSPIQAVILLSRQYSVFLPSALVAVASWTLMGVRLVQCIKARSFRPFGDHTLLFSWAAGGVFSFAVIALRFPQYFALFLIPTYCYLYIEVISHLRARLVKSAATVAESRADLHAERQRRRWTVPSGVAAAALIALGIGTYYSRVVSRNDNTLREVKQYMATHVGSSDLVITIESIGDEIRQPWCSEQRAKACSDANYVITYDTYLQGNPPNDPAFAAMISPSSGAVKVAVFKGFKETVTVYEVP